MKKYQESKTWFLVLVINVKNLFFFCEFEKKLFDIFLTCFTLFTLNLVFFFKCISNLIYELKKLLQFIMTLNFLLSIHHKAT